MKPSSNQTIGQIQIALVKDGAEVRVNLNRLSLACPIFIERVNVEELDGKGTPLGVFTTRINQYFDPGSGSSYLYSHTPTGSNVKQLRATVRYLEVDQTASSNVLAV